MLYPRVLYHSCWDGGECLRCVLIILPGRQQIYVSSCKYLVLSYWRFLWDGVWWLHFSTSPVYEQFLVIDHALCYLFKLWQWNWNLAVRWCAMWSSSILISYNLLFNSLVRTTTTFSTSVSCIASLCIIPIISKISCAPCFNSSGWLEASVITCRLGRSDAKYPGNIPRNTPALNMNDGVDDTWEVRPDTWHMPSVMMLTARNDWLETIKGFGLSSDFEMVELLSNHLNSFWLLALLPWLFKLLIFKLVLEPPLNPWRALSGRLLWLTWAGRACTCSSSIIVWRCQIPSTSLTLSKTALPGLLCLLSTNMLVINLST